MENNKENFENVTAFEEMPADIEVEECEDLVVVDEPSRTVSGRDIAVAGAVVLGGGLVIAKLAKKVWKKTEPWRRNLAIRAVEKFEGYRVVKDEAEDVAEVEVVTVDENQVEVEQTEE